MAEPVAGSGTERSPPVVRLLQELEALDRAYSLGHHGRWSGARRAELVDGCLQELFGAAEPAGGVALVALGGYGRGALSPGSDIDLLVVHDGANAERVAALAEGLLYPLWDAGLRVGHAVRTASECLAIASERLDVTTAMLDGRPLAGDGAVWSSAREPILESVRADPRAFADRLTDDAAARAERHGAVSSLLEPDLKDGTGGLRDAQALGWLEAAIGATLEDAGLLRPSERDVVAGAEEFLVRVRSALHLETGRPAHRLLLELQPMIASAMGFEDEPGLIAVDGLMRSVFEHARQLEHVRSSVFDRFLRGAAGALRVDPTPAGVLRAFAVSARAGEVLSPASLDAVDAATVPVEVEWTEDVREAFLELLRTGPAAAPAFEVLDRLGLLARYLPAWTRVRCRPQRDPYHRSSVDVHLLETFANASRLIDEGDDDVLAARAIEGISDRDGLLLGSMLHDIGKTGEGNHVPAGARIARATVDRIGLPDPTSDLVVFLVTEHLLLSDTATRRDLDDDELVLGVAARVGAPERLAALYLLTIADARATGSLAWTPWRATLVRELVAKVQRVLERGDAGADTAERVAERSQAVRAALHAQVPEAVDGFLRRMPVGYLLGVPPERIAEQFALVAPPIGAEEVRSVSVPGSRPGTHAVTVVAADRPGLLSLIAGALSLARLSILSAQVFTTEDGVAVDLFEVEGAFEPQIREERWREFRTTLRRAIEGRVSLEHRVRERRRHYPVRRVDIAVRVSVDNEASDFFTVIEVDAPDRIGLLFDVTSALAEQGLDVHVAKVATYGEHVVDAFYVRDDLGRRLEDPARIAELDHALRERLQGSSG